MTTTPDDSAPGEGLRDPRVVVGSVWREENASDTTVTGQVINNTVELTGDGKRYWYSWSAFTDGTLAYVRGPAPTSPVIAGGRPVTFTQAEADALSEMMETGEHVTRGVPAAGTVTATAVGEKRRPFPPARQDGAPSACLRCGVKATDREATAVWCSDCFTDYCARGKRGSGELDADAARWQAHCYPPDGAPHCKPATAAVQGEGPGRSKIRNEGAAPADYREEVVLLTPAATSAPPPPSDSVQPEPGRRPKPSASVTSTVEVASEGPPRRSLVDILWDPPKLTLSTDVPRPRSVITPTEHADRELVAAMLAIPCPECDTAKGSPCQPRGAFCPSGSFCMQRFFDKWKLPIATPTATLAALPLPTPAPANLASPIPPSPRLPVEGGARERAEGLLFDLKPNDEPGRLVVELLTVRIAAELARHEERERTLAATILRAVTEREDIEALLTSRIKAARAERDAAQAALAAALEGRDKFKSAWTKAVNAEDAAQTALVTVTAERDRFEEAHELAGRQRDAAIEQVAALRARLSAPTAGPEEEALARDVGREVFAVGFGVGFDGETLADRYDRLGRAALKVVREWGSK